jgi:hypothetical protein
VYKIGWPPDEKNQDEWPGKKSPVVGPYLFAAEPRDPVPRNIRLIGQRNRGQRRTLVLCRTGLRRTCCLRSWSVFRPSRLGACERGGRKAISIHRLYPEISWGRRVEGRRERVQYCDPRGRSRQVHHVAQCGTGSSRRQIRRRPGGDDRRAEKPSTGPHPHPARAGGPLRPPCGQRGGKGSTRRLGKGHLCGDRGQ